MNDLPNTMDSSGEGGAAVSDQPEDPPPHPFEEAVDKLIGTSRDIEDCVKFHIPLAIKNEKRELKRLIKELEQLNEDIKPPIAMERRSAVMAKLYDVSLQIVRIGSADHVGTLRVGLLLRLFSAYDSFTGEFLKTLFIRKPTLLLKLGRQVDLSAVLKAPDLETFREKVTNEEIEDFRRLSYTEQFKRLEKWTDISTLRAFQHWPDFIEAAQRRNLFTHCDGVVSDQYIAVCGTEGAKLEEDATPGKQLKIDNEYLLRATRIVMEVSLKLTQTVWRKCFPEELEMADQQLNAVGFRALQLQEWEWAELVGQFAGALPKHAEETNKLIALVNQAIAAKFGGQARVARDLMSSVDWSAKLPDFRLAVAVLTDDFAEASALMRRIGKKGELVNEGAYHSWPLFREFRSTEEFLEGYEEIYGYPFVHDLKAQRSALEKIASLDGSQEPVPESDKVLTKSPKPKLRGVDLNSPLRPQMDKGPADR